MDNTETANIRLLQNVKEITDFDASELDVYARLTEAQLLNKDHPEKGLFIAESPKVIIRALDGGYDPVSVLVEKKQALEDAERLMGGRSMQFDCCAAANEEGGMA